MTPFLFVARIWKVLYHECIGKTILPQGLYTRKRNSGLRRQRKAEGGRGYQLFPHPRHIPPGLAKNSDCGRAGRAGGHNPPPFGLRAEPANTGTSPLPVGCSHIHPKTACREVRERQWRSAAPVSAPASASAGRFPLGSGTRGSRRDQVLLSLPQNRRKHGFSPVSFLHVLHGYVVRVGLKSGFSHLVLSVPNRSHPLHHPKRTRLRLFGLCRVRFALFILF